MIVPDQRKWLLNQLLFADYMTLVAESATDTLNQVMHDLPVPTHPDTHLLSYAHEITILSQRPNPDIVAAQIQENSNILEQWLHTNTSYTNSSSQASYVHERHTHQQIA